MEFPPIITAQSQGGRAIEKLYEKQEFTSLLLPQMTELFCFPKFNSFGTWVAVKPAVQFDFKLAEIQ